METVDAPKNGTGKEPLPFEEWGSLRILEKLGGGGFGEVFRAHDPSLQIDVALKLIRPELIPDETNARRFIGEARRLARVRHENVVVVHGAEQHEGRVGLWTELLEGRTLEECLRLQGPFGPEEASVIGIELCKALAAVHAAGLVHRDVKTANVMRKQGGAIVLMDFSAATERSILESMSASDPVSGTPLFMAPEFFRGEAAGSSADIYSLGVVLYRLVTGRFPVEAGSISELYDKHRKGEPTPLRDVRADLPRAFIQVVERALASEPASRYRSVGEMERALTASLGSVPRIGDAQQEKPWWRRRALVGALAASVAIVAAIALALTLIPLQGPFQVEASLFRARDGTEERLLPGGRVEPGDRLFMEVEGSEDMHVYVLAEDEKGEAFVLFPLPNLDLQNPLPGGEKHLLPGTEQGRSWHWRVSSAGGAETVMVVAAREPLEDLAQEIAAIPRVGSSRPLAMNSQMRSGVLRGIGDLVEGDASLEPEPAGSLSGVFSGLSEQAAAASGIWIWQIELENQGE
jgi:hypothetical protein